MSRPFNQVRDALALGEARSAGDRSSAGRLDVLRKSLGMNGGLPGSRTASATAPRAIRNPEPGLEELARQEVARLAQQLFLRPNGKAPRAVLFAGVERENGCAGICVQAARAAAALISGQICIVDANLRSPSVHRCLDMENVDGMSAVLGTSVSAATLARRLSPDNLWLLSSGPAVPDPEDLLTHEHMRPHMQTLGARFDHILVSSPPVNVFGDSLTLGRTVDGVVLIIEANCTRRQDVWRAVHRLEAFDIPILGFVLNGRTFPIPEPLYRLL